ncbi:unnamed protein product [Leuciscus chuanchicus]
MVRPNRIKIPTPPPPPPAPPSLLLSPSLSPFFQTDCFAAVNGSRGERKRQEKQEDSGGRNENQDRQIHWDLSVSASRHSRVQHSRTNGANRHHEERLYRGTLVLWNAPASARVSSDGRTGQKTIQRARRC